MPKESKLLLLDYLLGICIIFLYNFSICSIGNYKKRSRPVFLAEAVELYRTLYRLHRI